MCAVFAAGRLYPIQPMFKWLCYGNGECQVMAISPLALIAQTNYIHAPAFLRRATAERSSALHTIKCCALKVWCCSLLHLLLLLLHPQTAATQQQTAASAADESSASLWRETYLCATSRIRCVATGLSYASWGKLSALQTGL
jgi:hypothetical protein